MRTSLTRRAGAAMIGMLLAVLSISVPPAVAAAQTLTWTADDDITAYRSAPATAVAGATTVVFENSAATGNTTGMPHTLTFDTTTAGYNHDVTLNILASPFDVNDGRHEATVTLTPGKYRYFCTIPGHSTMVGELTVTAGGGEDTTAPTVTGTVTGNRNADGHYVGSATVTVAAADTGSGVKTVEYQVDDTSWQTYTTPAVITAIGDHAVQFRATDHAGNVSTTGSVSFRVVGAPGDTTAPTVTAALTGEQDAAGNYLGRATATITATDAGSGVERTEYQLDSGAWTAYTTPIVVSAPGMHMLHSRATDKAGNTSAVQMTHFTVVERPVEDTTPPAVTAVVTGARDTGGAYLGTATVTITATDAESGVDTVEYRLDSGAWTAYTSPVAVSAAGAHTVGYRAADNAGNTAAERAVSFTVVAPGTDACPDSDTRDTVIIDGIDTRVPNADTGNGCTVNDLIAERDTYPTHAAFVRHVESVTASLVTAGRLTPRQAGTIVRAAARSDVGS
ncbi:plastocyanin/azurin family copper-binding protein [Actinoplanes sp. NEAU-A12]|uniref:Plastocyanin/azurin family copper-binding protein n=1 Tax=Actinoplanes sandaracinus TaxID=3045177 RepID=A0ABT6WWS6_9ACTN|nr:plastocyanin/azurin family copper-binding protein [Actinoplanes sandaracinus]MDI6104198.1 plastocyanin/azurin family copper-binding protein [Actinoplanes sandaracinus]